MVDLSETEGNAITEIRAWMEDHDVAILNVADPRESGQPGIHDQARSVMDALLTG